MGQKLTHFKWRKYLFETLSMFIAVLSAFALNNWNQNRRDYNAERDILKEVRNGIQNDLISIENNKSGNQFAKASCGYLRNLILNKPVNQDSVAIYFNGAFTDFSFTVNKTGYEGLASKGLDIIKEDLLRVRITYYYNYYFDMMTKVEEQNERMQAFKNYFFRINDVLAKYMEFDEKGELIKIKQPILLTEATEKQLLSYLTQMEMNRDFKINIYEILEGQMKTLETHVDEALTTKLN